MNPDLLAMLQTALEHHHAGRPDVAEQLYRAVLQTDVENTDALNLLGVLEYERSQNLVALHWLSKAVELAPQTAMYHNNLGLVLVALGLHGEAAARFEQAGQLDAGLQDTFHNLAVARQKLGRVDEAIAAYLKALALAEEPGTLSNLGAAYLKIGRCQDAMRCLERALQLQPDNVDALVNVAAALVASGRADEAVLAYDKAIEVGADDPVIYHNRSHARLVLGDFARGWDDYEYRWLWKEFPTQRPSFTQPAWTGDDLKGRTLLVYSEQGLGDTIQFVRYLRHLADQGASAIFKGPTELKSLLGDLGGACQVLDANQPLPPFDVHAALMSLPRLCGTRLENIPASVPYLPVPPAERLPLPPALPGRFRIGLVWAGGPRQFDDVLRSIPLLEFLPLLQIAGYDFYSLQVGPRAADLATLPAGLSVTDIGTRVRDFADTAAVMGQLDLIISVCTSTLHLAGALARPAWGVLRYAADWRWLLGREDSPWYPTMRLFRQPTPGDWESVVARLAKALQDRSFRPALFAPTSPRKEPDPKQLR